MCSLNTDIVRPLFCRVEFKELFTVKSRAVDRSTIQFLTIFGVLLTKTCYNPRGATIAISSNQSTDECYYVLTKTCYYLIF